MARTAPGPSPSWLPPGSGGSSPPPVAPEPPAPEPPEPPEPPVPVTFVPPQATVVNATNANPARMKLERSIRLEPHFLDERTRRPRNGRSGEEKPSGEDSPPTAFVTSSACPLYPTGPPR